ncbi:respiratory chain complex I subunit 1 family protein [Desulfatirhabdium butyrativorans]|uniref:respiratory chain complex I subunit 1 family protein n=1 Tax=Desulfatirhabdium butyrativorans TaxID=340467 RepID=UPI0003F8E580|nr:NADH-quinone oxidoreductase subunit H [Desulfatirhabdium butyrativorans]
MIALSTLFNILAALALAPLIPGLINRTKARIAGRTGQPMLQMYNDLLRLLRKGAVYSQTTSRVFRAGPIIGISCMVIGLLLVPVGPVSSPAPFAGDLIVLAYVMGLARYFTVSAALDTGSAFEGMGASREVQFSVLAEPAMLAALAALGLVGPEPGPDRASADPGFSTLSGMIQGLSMQIWVSDGTVLLLIAAALFIVMLAENCRIPVDDPTTHLELTMIHEVMVLDHSGPDFALILFAGSLKLWIFLALLAGILFPVRTDHLWVNTAATLAGMGILAIGIGIVESAMARLRLLRVPQLLAGALVLSVLALILVIWR